MTHGRGLLNGRPVSSWDTMPNSKKLSMVSQDLAPPPLGCNLSTNRKRKPKWRRCVAASIAVGPSAILTGSRTRPSDWGSNARLGPVEDRRKNRRLATFTCTLCVLQLSVFCSSLCSPDLVAVTFHPALITVRSRVDQFQAFIPDVRTASW